MRLVITGGHHSSAVPVIKKLKEKYPQIELLWIGHTYSLKGDKNPTLEYREISEMGIPFTDLKAAKVYRSLDIKNIYKIPASLIKAYLYLSKTKPDLILSFGGYIAVPVVMAGWLLHIPSITHEQTATVGYANRLISFFANKILISWKQSEKYFSRGKTVYTGLPLRESIYEKKDDLFKASNNLPFIFLLGGKTGSVKINQAFEMALSEILTFSNVILQCGDYSQTNYYKIFEDRYSKIKHAVPGELFLKKFIMEDEIGSAYGAASLVICRSGAHTVNELLALQKPALMIPISWVSHNEQYKNALIVREAGLGEILPEADLNAHTIVEKIRYMLHNLPLYKLQNAINYREISANAADLIVNEVLKYAK